MIMKLDSEEQRKELLEMLGALPVVNITIATLPNALAEMNKILDPIREAKIERKRKPKTDG